MWKCGLVTMLLLSPLGFVVCSKSKSSSCVCSTPLDIEHPALSPLPSLGQGFELASSCCAPGSLLNSAFSYLYEEETCCKRMRKSYLKQRGDQALPELGDEVRTFGLTWESGLFAWCA